MIYYSKIVKIKMDYITKYQYVKLIHFLRRHHMYSFINLIGSALCLRKMIVSIPLTSSPKFLDFKFVFELF